MKTYLILILILILPCVLADSFEYYHPNGTSDEDCFDGTCLTMPYFGPVYNSKGDASWGCGSCDAVTNWAGENIKALATEINCVTGMINIAGTDLCIKTDGGELWNIVFTHWSTAGSNEFGYIRTLYEEEKESLQEKKLADKTPSQNTSTDSQEESEKIIEVEITKKQKNDLLPMILIVVLFPIFIALFYLLFLKFFSKNKK